MLAIRNLRYLASRCQPAPLCTWMPRTRAPVALQTTTVWYVRTPAMTAAYSSNPKDAFTSLLFIQKRMDSTVAPEPKTLSSPTTVGGIKTVATSPTETKTEITSSITTPIDLPLSLPSSSSTSPEMQSRSDKSSKTKTTVKQTKSSSPLPPKPPLPGKSFASCCIPIKSCSPISSPSSSSSSTIIDKCSKLSADSRIQPPNIKLPSRDQVEKFFFTALVYVWDFCYYVFCLSFRLLDNYVLKNPTIQENWKKLMKRLDEQRQAIKSKK